MAHRLSGLTLALFGATSVASYAGVSGYSDTVFFGDSLTDSGYFAPVTAQMTTPSGKFTTNPDLVWSEQLGARLGHTVVADTLQGGVGNNHAIGGARAGVAVVSPLVGTPIKSVSDQVADHIATGKVDGNALYSVWAGANDLLAAASRPQEAQTIVLGAIDANVGAIDALHKAGARYILVPNLPDVGKAPAMVGTPLAQTASDGALFYSTAVYRSAGATGANIIPLDTFRLVNEVAANPQAYGFSNMTGQACLAPSSVLCNQQTQVADADGYFFADSVHPTGKAHRILGDYAYQVVSAPTQVAQLAHFASDGALAQTKLVTDAIDAKRAKGNTAQPWVMVSQAKGGGTGFDKTRKNVAVGVDYKPALLFGRVGAYVSRGDGDYNKSMLQLDLSETGAGVYYDNRYERVGLDAQLQLSAAKLSADSQRQVVLGDFSDTYHAHAKGSRVLANLRLAKPVNLDNVTIRPYVSATASRVHITNLSENSQKSTAMSFGEQSQDSTYASVGMQAAMAVSDGIHLNGELYYQKRLTHDTSAPSAHLNSLPDVSFVTPSVVQKDHGMGAQVGVTAHVGTWMANANAHQTQGFSKDRGFSLSLAKRF